MFVSVEGNIYVHKSFSSDWAVVQLICYTEFHACASDFAKREKKCRPHNFSIMKLWESEQTHSVTLGATYLKRIRVAIVLLLVRTRAGQAMHDKSYRCKWWKTMQNWLYRGWRPCTQNKEEVSATSSTELCDSNQENLPEEGNLRWNRKMSGRSWLQGKAGVRYEYCKRSWP